MKLLADPPPADPAEVEPVTPAELIGSVRRARARREAADRDILILGLAWATSHEAVGPVVGTSVGATGPGSGDFPDTPFDPTDHAVDTMGADETDEADVTRTETRRQWRGLPCWPATRAHRSPPPWACPPAVGTPSCATR